MLKEYWHLGLFLLCFNEMGQVVCFNEFNFLCLKKILGFMAGSIHRQVYDHFSQRSSWVSSATVATVSP